MGINEESLEMHEKFKGKLNVVSKIPLKDKHDLSLAYTPGVAEPCRKIVEDLENVYKYTIKGNCVAVISNGTAVLGLGDIGAYAAIPVMEGKSVLFKELAGINAFPICINSKDIEENVRIIKGIAPIFGGINLEDYKAPECFEIEEKLQDLGIPVMHDDQHGTAIVVLAGLINALKVAERKKEDVKIVVNGAGAAATAVTKMLLNYGFLGENLIVCDTKGIIYSGREDLKENKYKNELANLTNKLLKKGKLDDALIKSDVFIGLSKPGVLNSEMIKKMNSKPIIFALANPIPEIMPDEAKNAGAFIVATGRSDFPNQVNNSLAFPGVFKGALSVRAKRITSRMKIAAAEALSSLVKNPDENQILPLPLDKEVVEVVSNAVANSWVD